MDRARARRDLRPAGAGQDRIRTRRRFRLPPPGRRSGVQDLRGLLRRPAWAGEPTNERSTKARQGKPVQGRPSPIRFGRRSNLGLPGPGNHLPRRVQRGVAPHCPDSAHTRPCDAACSALPCAIACLRAPPRPARDPNPTCVRAGRPRSSQLG